MPLAQNLTTSKPHVFYLKNLRNPFFSDSLEDILCVHDLICTGHQNNVNLNVFQSLVCGNSGSFSM